VRRVWLVRHGATTAPPDTAIGATDLPLSDEGLEQARILAADLASRPLVRVLSSDLRRALSTADVIAAAHHLVAETTPALREIDFGSWEGRSLADLWSEEPRAAKAWEDDIRSTPPTFGENLADLQIRVEGFWRRVRPLDEGEVAIVAHRCSLAVLRAMITGESLEDAFSIQLAHGAAVAVIASS
jgi:broad specificity phosphatase PhoE